MAGIFVVIDGADGAGKSTQTEHLIRAAKTRRLRATAIHFPSYEGTEGGRVVQEYLYGVYGDAASIHPKLASLPYAIDRFEQSKHLRKLIRTQNSYLDSQRVASSTINANG